ncbi:MAG: response regulator transcription factor [Chloroflexi bacterium]|nr:response regulator transcription factor [Chloroflexota bacterium]
MAIRVLLADDHTLLRAGLRGMLKKQSCLEVVGEASDGEEVLQLANKFHPDVVVMDMNISDHSGVRAILMLQQTCPDTHVLIMANYEETNLLQEADYAGVSGFIVKRALESELIDAIKTTSKGDFYIHPSIHFPLEAMKRGQR